VLGTGPGSGRARRWGVALATLAIAVAGSVSVSQAASGGASPYPGPGAGGGSTGSGSTSGAGLVFSPPRVAGASWYGGPSLWGHKTACGQTLRPKTLGTAHRKLPCGTIVKFTYHGHTLVTQVIDRGPYVRGRSWDLTAAASEVLGLEGVGRVQYAVAITPARSKTAP
jgi:hypothetical protein